MAFKVEVESIFLLNLIIEYILLSLSYLIIAASKVDAFAYPLRLQTEIFFGNTQVVRFYGRLSFDVIAKELEFDLDEVISLGVKLDLASTVEIAEAEQEEEQITESSNDRPSFWRRIFRKRKASSEDIQTDEDSADDSNGT